MEQNAQLQVTMDAKEAAKYLGISYWLLLEKCKAKEIPHIRVGKRVLFRKETIDRWMTNQETLSLQPSYDSQVIGLARARG